MKIKKLISTCYLYCAYIIKPQCEKYLKNMKKLDESFMNIFSNTQ